MVNLNNMRKFYCTKKHPKVVSGNTDRLHVSFQTLHALYSLLNYINSISATHTYMYSVAVDNF